MRFGLAAAIVTLWVTPAWGGKKAGAKRKAEPPPAAEAPAAPPGIPRISRLDFAPCGCALYVPEGFSFNEATLSEDGSQVWTGEVQVEDHWFYAVVVRFKETIGEDAAANEQLLLAYLQFLQGQLNIKAAAGAGLGHRQESHPAARGVIDFWEDEAGDRHAVKAWVDPHRLAVLGISGKGEYPHFNVQQMYLDGFRFPAP